MQRLFLAFGTVVSWITLLLVGMKWKVPQRSALFWATSLAILVALPFNFIFRLCRTGNAMAGAMFAQVTFTLASAFGLLLYGTTRDPERASPQEDGIVVSPADGEVIYVRTVEPESTPLVTKNGKSYCLEELIGFSLGANGAHVIGIEMNMLNIHTNRCPIAGRVRLIHHIGGKFISLRDEEAPFVNERCTTVIENDSLAVAVVQVASRLVRRIDNYLHTEDPVSVGQRLGIIRFGSLVAVVVPCFQDVRIETRVGERVAAGLSILARYGSRRWSGNLR
jgi:phosphatidylserine decarboxylase